MMNWIYCKLFGWLQSRCAHLPALVSVDISEGCLPNAALTCCRICGAVRLDFTRADGTAFPRGKWRVPHAEWWIDERLAAIQEEIER
jgi:hypothetical protein